MTPRLDLAEAVGISYLDPNLYASNVQARIMVRNGVTVIAVAGSNDMKDWLQDLAAVLVHRNGRGQIFKGFAEMAEDSKDSFLAQIVSYPGPYEICGHSAGCAVALQWAAWMAEAGRKPQVVHLMAAPMTGDSEWASYYASWQIPTLRVSMLHDPVASLPGVHRGGSHVGEQLVLSLDGMKHEAQDLPSEINLPGIIAAAAKHHGMANYLRAIRCYLKAG